MITGKQLLKILNTEHGVSSQHTPLTSFITTGIVVDTDDPLQAGRLRVFCPTLNDDPKKLHHLPWAVYMSPFGGSISNNSYARGEGKGPENTDGAVAYGFWAIPEQGAKVLVTCIDGDERRRVWMGCLHEHQETHTLFHGRYDWEGSGKPEGPLSSKGSPIEPAYTNANKAFDGDMESREWKTRQAEYQTTAVPKSDDPPNGSKTTYLDGTFEHITAQEQDEWVKTIVGAHGYDWSGNKAVGSHMASRVFGLSTPGNHAFSMDDRAFNSRIRLRSATGHNIILDDTNERIYVATNEGNNWIELDSNGNIDIYSKRRVSIHAEKDINFSTDESFRVKAKKGIYMYAGDTRGQEELASDKPEDGEIRFHSTADTHIMVEKNLRTLVEKDMLTEVGGESCMTVAKKLALQVEKEINTIVNDGDFNISINGNYNHNATNDSSIFSGGDNKMQAVNNTEIFSFTGKMDIGSFLNFTMKSYIGDISIQGLSPKSNVKITSNAGANQMSFRNPAVGLFSSGALNIRSPKPLGISINKGFGISNGEPAFNGSPIDGGCLKFEGGVNVSFDTDAINFDALDDINSKVHKGVGAANKVVQTSINTINDNFDQLETKVNDLSYATWSKFAETFGVKTPFDILKIKLPALPSFPQPPSLVFPAIDLPDFDFDFCVEVEPFLQVDDFNMIPDNIFGGMNNDLGLFSKNGISNWVDRHKNKISNSVDSIKNAKDKILSFDDEASEIQTTVDRMDGALSNLVTVDGTFGNNALTSNLPNVTHMEEYISAVVDLNTAIQSANNVILTHNETAPEKLDDLTDFSNAVNDHSRSMATISKMIPVNGDQINNQDYSDMAETRNIIAQFSMDLGEL